MKFELQSLKIHLMLLLLGVTFIYGFPKNKITTNIIRVAPSSPEIMPDKMTRRQFDKSEDVIVYHENRDDGILKCLCWAELFIITENNKNKKRNLSNEFAIILESPGDIAEETFSEEAEAFTLFDSETNKSRTLNFTLVNKTEAFTIKQHKTLHCGAGPILIKTYIEWPKRNKQKIEIRLTPTTPSKWHISSDNTSINYDVNKFTPSPSSQTFDTTSTESYAYTNLEDITLSILETDGVAAKVSKKSIGQNKDLGDLKVGSKPRYHEIDDDDEAFESTRKKKVSKELVLKPSPINYSINKDRLNDLKLGMKRELLMRNMYLKKLSDSEKIFNITDPNFIDNLEYDSALYFFDLMYLNKSTSLWALKGHHKFLIDIQVSIEHVAMENINGTEKETPQSVMVLEEENIYHLNKN